MSGVIFFGGGVTDAYTCKEPVTDTVHQYWRLCCQICPNLKAFYRDYPAEKLVWDYLNSQNSSNSVHWCNCDLTGRIMSPGKHF